MAAWPEVELREVLRTDLASVPVNPSETYEMVGVYSFGRGLFRKRPVHGGNTSYRFFYRLKPDHFVMSQLFGWEGALALSSPEFMGLYVSPQFPTFLCDEQRLNRSFLGWFARSPSFWEDLAQRTRGMGDRRRTLNPEALLSCKIPLPPLDEQRRIVSRIEELAGKVETAQTLRSESASGLRALMQSRLSTMFNNLSTMYGLERVGELIIEANYGTSKKCAETRINGAVPVLRIPNVASELVNRGNLKYAALSDSELRQVQLRQGDILVVQTNGSADLVGRCAVVTALTEPTAFASYLIRLRAAPERVLADYLQLMLKHLRTSGNLIDFARTTAGQYNVSLGRLRTAQIPVPPLHEQQEIVNQMRALEAETLPLRSLQAETAAELDALMPSILSKAFRGEL